MPTYGFGGGVSDPTKTAQQQTNWQKQTPYAGQNNMFASQTQNSTPSAGQARTTQQTATGASPVLADGNINPASQAPVVAPSSTLAAAPQSPYPGRPESTEFTPEQLPTTPLQTYQPGQFSQYQAPDQSGIDQQQQALMSSILASPHSISDLGLQQMKEASKEQLLTNFSQQDQLAQANANTRGTMGGGTDLARQQMMQAAMNESLMGSNRGLDIQKMLQDRADELAAEEAATSFQNAQLGRSTQGYNTLLGGQQAQTAENQFGFGTENQAIQDSVQRAISQNTVDLGGANQNLQNYNTDVDAFMRRLGIDSTNNNALLGYITQLINSGVSLDLGQGQTGLGWGDLNASLIR